MQIATITPFLEYFENVRGRTLRLVRCIPPDKLEWRAAPGKFTLGDVVRHLAVTERYVFVECAAGRKNRYPGCGRELADGYDSVVQLIERLHAESMAMLSQLSDADLQTKCASPAGTPMTRWKLLRSMVEHEIHHRGELYAYLGILGMVVPPLYGLTSEQLKEIAG